MHRGPGSVVLDVRHSCCQSWFSKSVTNSDIVVKLLRNALDRNLLK